MVIPPRFFSSSGELRVSVATTHQLVENAFTGAGGSLTLDRSPVDFRFTLTGGATIALAERDSLGFLNYNTGNRVITIPQQPGGNAEPGDSVIQLGLNLELTRDGGTSWRTVDYASVTLIDGRDIQQESNQPVTDRPMGLQVTTPGIEKLGFTLQSSQPYPDTDSFNLALQNYVSQFQDKESLTASEPICFPLNSIPEFKQTSAWHAVRDEARAFQHLPIDRSELLLR